MTDSWSLDVLPYEILLIIFDHCDIPDLLRLSQVCKRFNEIIQANAVWIEKSKRPVVTNQLSDLFRKRCNPILQARKKCIVSYNWRYGRFKQNTIASTTYTPMPWLQMTDDMLWWSCGKYLYSIPRKDLGREKYKEKNIFSSTRYAAHDFSRFILWKNLIISSHAHGFIKYWSNSPYEDGTCLRSLKVLETSSHLADIFAMDVTSQNVISAVKDQTSTTLKIQRIQTSPDESENESGVQFNFGDSIYSLAVDPTESICAIGTRGINLHPLHILDLEYCKPILINRKTELRYGAGILDMVWENPHTFLTCGYDQQIHKWDMRTEKRVCRWEDPNGIAMYCISSDYQYTMVTGGQYNCIALLWDQRQSKFVQVYYAYTEHTSSRSPIYSLKFDSSRLYCATDRGLVELDFTDHLCQPRNYKQIYVACDERTRRYRKQ